MKTYKMKKNVVDRVIFVCLIITETQYVLMTIQNINTVTLFLRMMKYAKTISYDLA